MLRRLLYVLGLLIASGLFLYFILGMRVEFTGNMEYRRITWGSERRHIDAAIEASRASQPVVNQPGLVADPTAVPSPASQIPSRPLRLFLSPTQSPIGPISAVLIATEFILRRPLQPSGPRKVYLAFGSSRLGLGLRPSVLAKGEPTPSNSGATKKPSRLTIRPRVANCGPSPTRLRSMRRWAAPARARHPFIMRDWFTRWEPRAICTACTLPRASRNGRRTF